MRTQVEIAKYIVENFVAEYVEEDGGYPLLVLRETHGRECCECGAKATKAVSDLEDDVPFGGPYCDEHEYDLIADICSTSGMAANRTNPPEEIARLWAEGSPHLFEEGTRNSA